MNAVWIPLALSLKVAGWATLLNLVFGVAIAYGLARWRSSARDLVDSILTLPLVLPPTVLGYYLLVVLGRRGVVGTAPERGQRPQRTLGGAVRPPRARPEVTSWPVRGAASLRLRQTLAG